MTCGKYGWTSSGDSVWKQKLNVTFQMLDTVFPIAVVRETLRPSPAVTRNSGNANSPPGTRNPKGALGPLQSVLLTVFQVILVPNSSGLLPSNANVTGGNFCS